MFEGSSFPIRAGKGPKLSISTYLRGAISGPIGPLVFFPTGAFYSFASILFKVYMMPYDHGNLCTLHFHYNPTTLGGVMALELVKMVNFGRFRITPPTVFI